MIIILNTERAAPLYQSLKLRLRATSQRSIETKPDQHHNNETIHNNTNDPGKENVIKARALFDFDPQIPGDLGFELGEVIEVIEKTDKKLDWWKGRIGDRVGNFPANYVQVIEK